MENEELKKSTLYYYTGSLLVALALLFLISVFSFEALYNLNTGFYLGLIAVLAGLCLVAAIVTPYLMIRKKREAILEYGILSTLRLVLSTILMGYAFAKLRSGHMYLSYFALDTRMNDLDDFNLVWSFYGRSSLLQALLGIMEFIPAVLLLFRRSALIGALIALPVVANIVLLNTFYEIGKMTLPLSLSLMIFDLYLLYAHKQIFLSIFKTAAAFSKNAVVLGSPAKQILTTLKFLPLCLFGGLILLRLFFQINSPQALRGAYELLEYRQNGLLMRPDSLPGDAYRKIYFEKRHVQNGVINARGYNTVAMEFGPKDSIRIAYRNGPLDGNMPAERKGAFFGIYKMLDDSLLQISGTQNSQKIEAVYKPIALREFAYWWE